MFKQLIVMITLAAMISGCAGARIKPSEDKPPDQLALGGWPFMVSVGLGVAFVVPVWIEADKSNDEARDLVKAYSLLIGICIPEFELLLERLWSDYRSTHGPKDRPIQRPIAMSPCGEKNLELKKIESEIVSNGPSHDRYMKKGAILEKLDCLEEAIRAYKTAVRVGPFDPSLDAKIQFLERKADLNNGF
ncbi:MAG: hypothetical protein V4498_08520 [candidate division FCPU426 bacterium]